MSSDDESIWFDRLKARIKEHNQKDLQAILRAKEERGKLAQQVKDEDSDQAALKT
jgi:hypothetical protein